MAKSIYQSELILKMNSRLFINALDGVTEEQALERISGHNNPLNWMGAHTVWGLYLLCEMLGKPAAINLYKGMFENFKPFDPTVNYQTLAEIRNEWEKVTNFLNEALESVTEEHLAADGPWKNPIGDQTYVGIIAFLTQHESYDIGQIALLKKYFTMEPMKY